MFFEEFSVDCLENITLYATADNKYEAYINGILVLQGSDWRNSNSRELQPSDINLKVGEPNLLRIKATNWHGGSPAGLAYQITRSGNQVCEELCPDNKYFNYHLGECKCMNSCECGSPQVWSEEHCGCQCPQV